MNDEEEWIPYKGFEDPKPHIDGDTLKLSWQPKDIDELKAFVVHHFGMAATHVPELWNDLAELAIRRECDAMKAIAETVSVEGLGE